MPAQTKSAKCESQIAVIGGKEECYPFLTELPFRAGSSQYPSCCVDSPSYIIPISD